MTVLKKITALWKVLFRWPPMPFSFWLAVLIPSRRDPFLLAERRCAWERKLEIGKLLNEHEELTKRNKQLEELAVLKNQKGPNDPEFQAALKKYVRDWEPEGANQ